MSGELPPEDAPPSAEHEAPAGGEPPQRVRYVRMRPHRASTVLGLGVSGVALAVFGSMMALSLYFCCPLWLVPLGSLGLSIPAWQMGHADLAAMRAMQMDPAGRDSTTIGMICGIIGVAIIALGTIAILLMVTLYAVLIAISAASSQP